MLKNNTLSQKAIAQQLRLLDALRNAGSMGVTTIYAREELDIMMPAARIHELRHGKGFNIQLITDQDVNAKGHVHQCARYVLLAGTWKRGDAA